jgi:hypothetical protein
MMMQINLLRFGCVRWTDFWFGKDGFRALICYDRPLELARRECMLSGKGTEAKGRPLGPMVKVPWTK